MVDLDVEKRIRIISKELQKLKEERGESARKGVLGERVRISISDLERDVLGMAKESANNLKSVAITKSEVENTVAVMKPMANTMNLVRR